MAQPYSLDARHWYTPEAARSGVIVIVSPLNPTLPSMVVLSGMFQVMLYKPPGGSTLQVRDTTPEESLSSAIVTSDGVAEVGEVEEGTEDGNGFYNVITP